MKNLLHPLKFIYHSFFNMTLTYKLILLYIVVILFPTITLEYTLYNQNYHSIRERFLQNEQNALDIAQKNLNIQLTKIQESSDFLSSNTILTSYLNGFYNSQSEEVYYYIKDIKPLLDYLLTSDTAISNITFYGLNHYYLNWGGRLVSTDNSPIPSELNTHSKELISGIWYKTPKDSDTLFYYRYLYNTNYITPVATLCIEVSLTDLMNNFSGFSGSIYLEFSNINIPLFYQNEVLSFGTYDELNSLTETCSICQTYSEELKTKINLLLNAESLFHYDGNLLLWLLFLLFFFLTTVYYIFTRSITKRITTLQKHITQAKADNLTILPIKNYNDEIGQLTNAYNQMITRINDLLFQIYHIELKKKEAEFYALQAQIEPHFLYNVLENIHMSAEQYGDFRTASMVLSLGKFMRYNLNTETGFVKLSDEILHAKNYLDIHKVRMQDNLNIQITFYTEIDDITCPRFILQPLLENAIKHGVIISSPLTITLTVKDDPYSSDVLLEIHDNGKGISPDSLEMLRESLKNSTMPVDSHIGLHSINNRLKAFFHSEHSIYIDSNLGTGTTITLFLKRQGACTNENFNCRR